MPYELIQSNNGRIAWHETVGKFFNMLSPWGAAASVIPHLAACAIEIRKLRIEADHLVRQHAFASDVIQARREVVIGVFELEKLTAMQTRIDRQDFRDIFKLIAKNTSNMSLTPTERMFATEQTVVMSGQLLHATAIGGSRLIRLFDGLNLDNTEASVTALLQLER